MDRNKRTIRMDPKNGAGRFAIRMHGQLVACRRVGFNDETRMATVQVLNAAGQCGTLCVAELDILDWSPAAADFVGPPVDPPAAPDAAEGVRGELTITRTSNMEHDQWRIEIRTSSGGVIVRLGDVCFAHALSGRAFVPCEVWSRPVPGKGNECGEKETHGADDLQEG